ncbi:DUF1566 domain-containing protein [candidate division KSB1 bacterium]|nr:DUF1566 domain-containing protein [candidate division KSB1 bacterium]
MPPDAAFFTKDLNTLVDWAKFIGTIISILGGLAGLLVIYFTKLQPWYRARRRSRILEDRVGAKVYTKGIIEQAIRYYIEPECQDVDPSGRENPKLLVGVRQNLFAAVDNMLNNPTEYRYFLLLADSGMGKTSFVINYYARNLFHHKKSNLVILPLGIPDVDERIQNIDDKENKILFLDAFDEDTLAIVDHVERLKTLMELTKSFEKIIITCRTQFFPRDEEIPKETGIVKIGPKKAGEGAKYVFHKLYLSPFTDQQITQYLKKRYPFGQKKRRRKAREMVARIPDLGVRPMLLAHIDDLVETNREINYCFELYEEMVEAWLTREEKIIEDLKKDHLRQFSERLAVNLYVNRKQRGAERIHYEELVPLAKTWNIPLDDWQLRGRSLLNRDADGNYKFAHRSIMEYLFLKRIMDLDKNERQEVEWTDQMQRFFREMVTKFWKIDPNLLDLTQIPVTKLPKLSIIPSIELRNKKVVLSLDDAKKMLHKHNFFASDWNNNGKGITHQYLPIKFQKDLVVIDLATGLMWQQSGSPEYLYWKDVQKWIDDQNQKGYAGYHDWRLPTLEEAMSLMEPTKLNGALYIDPVFDKTQRWIWTADQVAGGSLRWVVYFNYGHCDDDGIYYNYYVRLVRSGLSSTGE